MTTTQDRLPTPGNAFSEPQRLSSTLVLVPAPDADDEPDPLPETPEGCDAEIEELEDTADDIAAQIEMADQGLTHQGDYEDWRRRALGALKAVKKELHQLYRQKNRLEHEARLRAQQEAQAEREAKARAKATRNAEKMHRISEEAHRRKMERILAANDRDRQIAARLRLWLRETHPEVWTRAVAECLKPAEAALDGASAHGEDRP